MNIHHLFFCTALAFSATACVTEKQTVSNPPVSTEKMAEHSNIASDLSKYLWQLSHAVDEKGKVIDALQADIRNPDGSQLPPVTLSFTTQPAHMQVSNACNAMSANYTLHAQKLTIGHMRSTLMACATPLMARERAAAQWFQNDLSVQLDNQSATPTLTLTTAQGERMTFIGTPTAETKYGNAGQTQFLEIAAHTQPCDAGVMKMQCLQAREIRYDAQGLKTFMGEWQYFYDPIEGYTHRDGTRNILRLKRYERPQPIPADASSYVYVLDMVVESAIEAEGKL